MKYIMFKQLYKRIFVFIKSIFVFKIILKNKNETPNCKEIKTFLFSLQFPVFYFFKFQASSKRITTANK